MLLKTRNNKQSFVGTPDEIRKILKKLKGCFNVAEKKVWHVAFKVRDRLAERNQIGKIEAEGIAFEG